MKSIALLVVSAMMCSSLALAQEQKPAAKDVPKPAAEAAKPAETAKPVAPAKKPAGAKKAQRADRRTEDARHCLGRPSTTEIIKCAEAYL
jgi:hypothetical protein